ncbi:MAG TPA: nitroreductase/quinone reductase family protein [Acidimicrobiales bacterium]|nr:nitroreductase/quinone reductase family protein [Acidimicrobiales bacterium]
MKLPEWLYSRLAKDVPALHRRLWRITSGRFGWRLGEVEFCLLTTIGQRTGQPRTTPLVLIRTNTCLFLVASNGGSDRYPNWYLNLVKHPIVTLEMKGARVSRYARVASESERIALWPEAERVYAGYGAYQLKTDRVIPIVIIEEDPNPGSSERPR